MFGRLFYLLNNMKRVLILFSLIALPFLMFSQAQRVHWGPVYIQEGGFSNSFDLIGIYDNHYYILDQGNAVSFILKYDFNHELISEEPLILRSHVSPLLINDIIHTTSGTYLILHNLDHRKQIWSMHASKFENGIFQDPIEIYSEKFKLKMNRLSRHFESFERGGGPGLLVSEDSTKVAFVNLVPADDYKQNEVIAVGVFDDKLNLQWQTKHNFKFSRKSYEITQSTISPTGEVYLLGWTHKKRSGTKVGSKSDAYLPDEEYKVYEIRPDEIITDIVNLGNNHAAMDVAMFFPDYSKKEYLLSGFYTDNDHKSQQVGIFFASGHPEKGIESPSFSKFDKKFVQRIESQKAAEKGKGLSRSFEIKNLIQFEDGLMGFIAEEYYVSVQRDFDNTYYGSAYYPYRYYNYYNNFNNQLYYTFHSNDLIIPIFNSERQIVSIESINKDYSSSTVNDVSYVLAENNDKAYLIFNDRKNRSERKQTKMKGSQFSDLVVLNSKGQVESRETIFSNREMDLKFVTDQLCHNDDIMLIVSQTRNRFSIGLMFLD